jgi:hypothetical protein
MIDSGDGSLWKSVCGVTTIRTWAGTGSIVFLAIEADVSASSGHHGPLKPMRMVASMGTQRRRWDPGSPRSWAATSR